VGQLPAGGGLQCRRSRGRGPRRLGGSPQGGRGRGGQAGARAAGGGGSRAGFLAGAGQLWGDRPWNLPGIDRTQLPDRASFHSPSAFCATWAHEPIHSTGHESRLKRDLGGAFGKARYAREELVAELGAVLLGDRLEIGSEIESHAAYLGHWIELLKESPKVLFQVLSEARQAADLICPEFTIEKC